VAKSGALVPASFCAAPAPRKCPASSKNQSKTTPIIFNHLQALLSVNEQKYVLFISLLMELICVM